MPIRSTVIALCVLLVIGCTEAYSPVPEGVRPAPKKVVVPDCQATHGVDDRSFALIIEIIRRNGDIQRANTFYTGLRKVVEARLAQGDPTAAERARPALDAFFSGAEIEKRAVCAFTRYDKAQAEIEAWDAWSTDETMREIHGRVLGFMAPKPALRQNLSGERRALVAKVANATGLSSYVSMLLSAQRQAYAVADAAMDPTSSLLQDIRLNGYFIRPLDEDALIDRILGPQLAGVSDDDLRRFLSFAETHQGRMYYETLRESYTYTLTDWYDRLAVLLKTNAAPAKPVYDPEAAAPMVAEARRLLDDVGTWVVLAEARTLLLKAERLDPENADIKALLGQVALSTVPKGLPLEEGEIRARNSKTSPVRSEPYQDAESYLRRAIELNPKNAEAHLYLGNIRFRLSQDDEAAKEYAIARQLDPKLPGLLMFEADLDYVAGRYAKAETAYRRILAAPEQQAFDHYHALNRLQPLLMKQGRAREFRGIAEAQLRRNPELWDFRLNYADHLLATDGTVDEVLALVTPVPDSWLPERKRATLTTLQLLRVLQAPPSGRDSAARRVFDIENNAMRVAGLMCRARGRADIAPAMIRASSKQGAFADELLSCGFRNRDVALLDVVMPFIADINAANAALNGELPLCAATSQMNVDLFKQMLKAKADPKRRCGDGKTPREQLTERAIRTGVDERFNADARALLTALDTYEGGH